MSTNLIKLVELLNDHNYHDGTSIGNQLNITRAAVWKIIKKLENYGILLKSNKHKGYLLEEPLILLDPNKINSLLQTTNVQLNVVEKVNSTIECCKSILKPSKKTIVYFAETQTQGRGRMNRDWYSPFGQNIYFSMLRSFQKDISELSGLSLIVGLAICNAIESSYKLEELLYVKWPNDIIVANQKIAGVLIDLQAEANGFCSAIISIGINVNMLKADKNQINQNWSSLRKLSGEYYDRNLLCAELVNSITNYLERFQAFGLADFMKEWKNRDYLFKQPVRLLTPKFSLEGTGNGINHLGHLVLTMPDGNKQAFSFGDTSVRLKA